VCKRESIYVCIYTAPEGDQRLTSSGLDIGPVQVLMQVVCMREREYMYVHVYLCVYMLRPKAIRDGCRRVLTSVLLSAHAGRVCACVRVYTHTHIYMYTYVCVDTYVCMYTALERDQRLTSSGLDIGPVEVLMQVLCVRVCVFIHIHIYIYVYIYMCGYIRVYIYCARRRSETDVIGF